MLASRRTGRRPQRVPLSPIHRTGGFAGIGRHSPWTALMLSVSPGLPEGRTHDYRAARHLDLGRGAEQAPGKVTASR